MMARHWRGVAGVLLLALLPVGLMPSTALAAASLVQQTTGSATNAFTYTLAPASATTVGNLLVMVGANWCTALTSVTGNGVTTWYRAAHSTSWSNLEIWYGVVDTSSTAGVTISIPNPTSGCSTGGGTWMNLSEWSGVSPILDGASAQSGTTSPASAGSITTSNANDLIILGTSIATGNLGTPSPGTWTAMTAIATPDKQSSWYQAVSSAGPYNPSVTVTGISGSNGDDAAMAAFQTCSATDPTYVVANAQSGQTTVYSTPLTPVIVVRNTTGTFTAPTNTTQYCVSASGGCTTTTVGSDPVVYVGEAGSFTQTTTDATNPITNNTLYYYKVYTNCALSYSSGVVVNIKPANSPVQQLWSYGTTATTLAAAGIDDNDVVVWGGNDSMIHGADSGVGTPDIAPFTTGGAIQSRPTIIPAAYSATGVNVAYVTSQDGYVYAINTTTGAQIWKSTVPGSNLLQGGAAVWLKALDPLAICGAVTDVVFIGTRDTVNHTTNSVYALNGGTSNVTSTGGGNCRTNGTSVAPGDYLWKFTGAGSNPSMDYISSTPYIDYTANVLWVTSRAQAGTSQPSLWKFNVTNGMLANGLTNCGSGATTSCWSLGDIDNSPSPSFDGTWMYVTTAMATATLQAVQGATVYSYTPAGSGVLSAPIPVGSKPFGTTTTIAYVNSNKGTATGSTQCQVTLPSMTAGNTIVVASAVNSATVKVSSITDSVGSFYATRSSAVTTGATAEIWTATAGAGAGSTVTITYNGSVSSVCSAAQYSGVGALGTNFNSSGSAKTATVAVTTNDTNNWVVAAFATLGSTTPTALAGNLRQAAALSTPIGGALNDNSSSSAGSVTNSVTIATTNTSYVATAVELRSVTVDSIAYTRPGTTRMVQFSGTATSTWYSPGPFGCSCGGVAGTPVYDGVNSLYTGSSNGRVWRADAGRFSNFTWVTISGSSTTVGDPSFDGVLNRVYVGSADGHVYGLTPGW